MHSGLTLNDAFSLGHGSIKVLPTPDNTAQQRNKGMAKNHSKSLVSNITGKYREELCMTGNEMATSDCLGGWISCLQLLHAFAIPIMRLMWNRRQSFWSCLTQTALVTAAVVPSRAQKWQVSVAVQGLGDTRKHKHQNKGNMAYMQYALNAHIPKIAATQFMTLDAACILSFLAKELNLKKTLSN